MFDFLPAVDNQPLSKPPISNVIIQVKFPNQRLFTTHAGASELQDALGHRYPRLLAERQTVVTAGSTAVNTEVIPQYRLTDLEGAWSLIIGAEALTLETSCYTSWTDARERFDEALKVACDAAKMRVAERVGLRYVNHFAQERMTQQVRPELLALTQLSGPRNTLGSAVSQYIFRDNATVLLVRTGLANEDRTRVTPYLLDVDVASSAPTAFDRAAVIERLDGFNDVAFRFFSWSLTPQYLDELRTESP
ncbi:TIGR04255 family protein [Catellatospora aurea]|uniref:TIGR04255 family protein n=1 Tax=Catellatospora aurea TaxID=1337874 RepID=A0ABW2H2B5_9ACTN